MNVSPWRTHQDAEQSHWVQWRGTLIGTHMTGWFTSLWSAVTSVLCFGFLAGAKPFDGMNGIAASLLLNMTSSMRFDGSLNVDLNDITMNLVPFPRMHFLLSSMSPLTSSRDVGRMAAPRTLDQVGTVPILFQFLCVVYHCFDALISWLPCHII